MLTAIQQTPHRREVTIILQMLLWCDERLTLEGCNHAISVRPEAQPDFSTEARLFDTRDIITICSGLVTTTWTYYGSASFQYLKLAHASVREYLLSEEVIQPFQSHLAEKTARVELLRMCHTYLCCIDWNTLGGDWRGALKQEYPLARWASFTWRAHAKHLDATLDEVSVLNCHAVPSTLCKHCVSGCTSIPRGRGTPAQVTNGY